MILRRITERAKSQNWFAVGRDGDIAESAARPRVNDALTLPDAIQLASALAIHADALVAHDRDFAKVRGMRVLG